MITIESIAELDKKILECDSARNDAELRSIFRTFRMKHAASVGDPFSNEYAEKQHQLYNRVAGRRYNLQNEETIFDIDTIAKCPFPYSTGSAQVIGNQLFAIGSLLSKMKISSGARLWNSAQAGGIRP